EDPPPWPSHQLVGGDPSDAPRTKLRCSLPGQRPRSGATGESILCPNEVTDCWEWLWQSRVLWLLFRCQVVLPQPHYHWPEDDLRGHPFQCSTRRFRLTPSST